MRHAGRNAGTARPEATAARPEAGATLVELLVSAGLLLTVLTPLMVHIGNAQERERDAAGSSRASGEGRVALDLLARDVRDSRLITAGLGKRATLWIDENDDDQVDPGEEIVYEMAAGALTRYDGTTTRTLIDHLSGTSTLRVNDLTAGPSLEITLEIDYTGGGQGAVVLHTEVFARAG